MEKDNKYYDIIADIVKKHRKFSGLEAILDDIVDDVYNHSEVIINSVPNENVIKAYIEKVVSTSIITVPKRMGFHSEIRHAVVSTTPQHVVAKNDVVEKVNNTLVDKMINSAEAITSVSDKFNKNDFDNNDNVQNDLNSEENEHEELLSSLDNELEQDNEEVTFQDELADNDLFSMQREAENELNLPEHDAADNELFETSKEVADDESLLELPSEESDDIVEEGVETEVDILQDCPNDETLVMENKDDVSAQSILENNDDVADLSSTEDFVAELTDEEEPIVDEVSDKTDETQEELIANTQSDVTLEQEEAPENLNLEDDDSILELSADTEKETDVEYIHESEENTELELDNPKNEVEIEDLEAQVTEDAAESALDIEASVDTDILPDTEVENENLLHAENSDDLEMEKTDELMQVEDFDDLELKSENDELELTDELSLDFNNDFLETSGSELNELEQSDEENHSLELQIDKDDEEKFATTDFSKFDFNPSAITPLEALDTDLIVKDIQDLANKKPELNVIDIYNMKYKDNKSIAEISTELGIDEKSVIDTLNEIIAVI